MARKNNVNQSQEEGRLTVSAFESYNQARTLCQRASLIAQLVKNPPAMQETPVQFLGQKDPLEKG